jgi:hypothetical protein
MRVEHHFPPDRAGHATLETASRGVASSLAQGVMRTHQRERTPRELALERRLP